MTSARVASLHVYPVKGCRGIAAASITAATTGFVVDGVGDREWMVTDREGRFLTQRELPRLALVETAVANGALTLSVPHVAPLAVPMVSAGVAPRDVIVWRSDVRGVDMGDAAAHWLSAWLAADVRLVRFDRSLQRACNPEFAGDSGAHTFFADGYPVLVIGEASLADLNVRLSQTRRAGIADEPVPAEPRARRICRRSPKIISTPSPSATCCCAVSSRARAARSRRRTRIRRRSGWSRCARWANTG